MTNHTERNFQIFRSLTNVSAVSPNMSPSVPINYGRRLVEVLTYLSFRRVVATSVVAEAIGVTGSITFRHSGTKENQHTTERQTGRILDS